MVQHKITWYSAGRGLSNHVSRANQPTQTTEGPTPTVESEATSLANSAEDGTSFTQERGERFLLRGFSYPSHCGFLGLFNPLTAKGGGGFNPPPLNGVYPLLKKSSD